MSVSPPTEQDQSEGNVQVGVKRVTFQSLLVESTPRFFITPIILALNVLIFVMMVLSGVSLINPEIEHLLNWGANFGPFTLNQEWWRLLTSVFVHIGVLHLVFNMQCLWNLGSLAERMFGNGAFLMLYLVSGLGGSIASLWWNPRVVGAGASGAIFGVAGGLVVFLYQGKLSIPPMVIKKNLQSILVFVGYNLMYGFAKSGIDNAAHLGGLVTGLVTGALLLRSLPPMVTRSRLWNYVAVLGVVLILILSVGFVRQQIDDPLIKLTAVEQLLTAGEYDQAIAEIEQVLKNDPDLAVAHYYLGNAYGSKEQYDQAIVAYTQAIRLDPQYASAYANRGFSYALTNQYDQAMDDLNQAIEIGISEPGSNAFTHFLRGAIYAEKGERERAISDLERALELGLDPNLKQNAESLLEELGR
jgi:membrane associated rhomboid family serine protease/predicted negative regulator of RcsB-dependent stress response